MAKTAQRRKAAAVWVDPAKLKPWPGNPRVSHETELIIEDSIKRFGFGSPIVARRANKEIINGHSRWRAALKLKLKKVPVRFMDLDENTAHALALADNQVATHSTWNVEALKTALEELSTAEVDLILGTGFSEADLAFLNSEIVVPGQLGTFDESAGLPTLPRPEDPDRAPGSFNDDDPRVIDVSPPGDLIYPATENDLGIPTLDLDMQAVDVVEPVRLWGAGRGGRGRREKCTWIFYTDDYRFNAVWSHPEDVVASRALIAGEVNFSVFDQAPKAVAIWRTYQKRWLARFWQSRGIKVMVDLNVSPIHADVNLLGIPRGWKAWHTRGYTKRLDITQQEYQRAVNHAGTTDITFLVYGGGVKVKNYCKEQGWLWVPENRDVGAGRFKDQIYRPEAA